MATATTNNSIVQPSAPADSAYRGPCPILGAHVTRVTHRGSTRILCSEYCETEGICRLRKAALEGGTLQGLIEATSEGMALGGTSCVMLTA
jgi:hypothetical protein